MSTKTTPIEDQKTFSLAKYHSRPTKRCNIAHRLERVENEYVAGVSYGGPKDSKSAIRVNIGAHVIFTDLAGAKRLAERILKFVEQAR